MYAAEKRALLRDFHAYKPITEPDLPLDHVPEHVFSHLHVQQNFCIIGEF